MNSQHDPTKKHNIAEKTMSIPKTDANCVSKAIKYPNGVLQLNGNLQNVQ